MGGLWTYYVARPLSFYPTALFLNAGVSANQTTGLSIVMLLLGCGLLALANFGGAVLGALLVNAWLVLDCVDGNIARFRQSASAYGGFLDALGGYLAYGLLFFSAGVGGYYHPDRLLMSRILPEFDGSVVLILGAWSSLTALWIRLVYQRFNNSFQDRAVRRHDLLSDQPDSTLRIALSIGNNLFNVSGLLPFLLLAAAALGAMDVLLALAAFANTAACVIILARLVREASESEPSSS